MIIFFYESSSILEVVSNRLLLITSSFLRLFFKEFIYINYFVNLPVDGLSITADILRFTARLNLPSASGVVWFTFQMQVSKIVYLLHLLPAVRFS